MPPDPFRSYEEYELFVYSLTERFPSIRRSSTLVCVRRGATLARIAGELHFDRGFRLVVRERLVFDRLPVLIDAYGYEVWRGDEKLFWYDSNRIPTSRHSEALTHTTSTYRRTSSTTAFRRPR